MCHALLHALVAAAPLLWSELASLYMSFGVHNKRASAFTGTVLFACAWAALIT
jgi:hypothetical protein